MCAQEVLGAWSLASSPPLPKLAARLANFWYEFPGKSNISQNEAGRLQLACTHLGHKPHRVLHEFSN
jgi:hypothetical protein